MTPITHNRHSDATLKALENFKTLANSLDGWKLSSEKNHVKLYEREKPDTTEPVLVRGDCVYPATDIDPLALSTVAIQPGCRKIWDDRFDASEIKELFSRYEALFWVKLKAPWPVSPRDFSATSIRVADKDVCYVSMVSVEDALIPEQKGCQRGRLLCSGWRMSRVDEGVHVTYVSQVDLAGSLPASLLQTLLKEIPLCAGKVVHYAETYGSPPLLHSCTAAFRGETFDHAKRIYELSLDKGSEGDQAECLVSPKMFPTFAVTMEGQADYEISPDDSHRVLIKNVQGQALLRITKS